MKDKEKKDRVGEAWLRLSEGKGRNGEKMGKEKGINSKGIRGNVGANWCKIN